jgi:hypothetical protein
MADNERDVWQTPRNTGIGAIADMLAAGKRGLNYVQLADLLGSPMLAGTAVRRNLASGNEGLGVGDLLLGQAPEEVDRWSYGDSPFYEQHYGFNPTLRPDRRANILDTTLLPVGEAVGAAKLMGRGATKAADKAGITSLLKDSAPAVEATDKGRRAVLKGLAAVPAAAAAAHVAPKLFEKTAAKEVEKAGTKTAAKAVAHATPREFFDTMEKLHDDMHHASVVVDEPLLINEAGINRKSWGYTHPKYQSLLDKATDDFVKKHGVDKYSDIIYRNQAPPEIDDILYNDRLEDALAELRKDPKFSAYADYVTPDGHHSIGADLITPEHPIHEKIKHKAHGGSIENTTHDRKLI